jgi:hypothetical protein
MMKKIMIWLVIVVIIVITAVIVWTTIVSNVEQAKYTVVESFGDIEIRDYSPMIVAEVDVSGDRDTAANKGFRLLADYIFGNNTAANKIAMTAPVMQKTNMNIAMTAPVIQEGNGDKWKVRFVMPSSYTMNTLPKPNNSLIKLIPVAGRRFVVIRFSGLASKKNLQTHEQMLIDFVKAKKIETMSEPIYAFFNPPWTLPPLRRNEIMMEVKR